MKILKVIHGFPPDYMAGSEIYSYHLVKELQKQGEEVSVFSRAENQFHPNYKIYRENFDGIDILRVNKPKRDYKYSDKFFDLEMDQIFRDEVKKIQPDIIHFGHLSHLSTNLIEIAKNEFHIPVVYTIHDFWLFCVKGQMINQDGNICEKPSIENCQKCSPYIPSESEVKHSFKQINKIVDLIDIFVSPSHTLKNFFISQGVPKEKIVFSKYGFAKDKINFNKKVFTKEQKLKFGFMGRVIPVKGISTLIEAFNNMPNENISIYGNIGNEKRFLEDANIQFMGGYTNSEIGVILQNFDVLIVPSIWLENSPLVIQEAFLSGTPVITSNIGGMAELVKDKKTGFTFEVDNSKDLEKLIYKISNNPEILNSLESGEVVSIQEDVQKIRKIYKELL